MQWTTLKYIHPWLIHFHIINVNLKNTCLTVFKNSFQILPFWEKILLFIQKPMSSLSLYILLNLILKTTSWKHPIFKMVKYENNVSKLNLSISELKYWNSIFLTFLTVGVPPKNSSVFRVPSSKKVWETLP